MKGAVKKNISLPTGRRDARPIVAASPASVETISWSDFTEIRASSQRGVCLQKLKSRTTVLLPTIVLSEPRGLSLFQVVRGG